VEEKTRKAKETFGKGILISFPPTRPLTQPNQTHNQKGKQRKKRKTEREREIKKEEVELERRGRGSREHKKKAGDNEKGDRTSSGQIVTIVFVFGFQLQVSSRLSLVFAF
jgi:hypothetical protein